MNPLSFDDHTGRDKSSGVKSPRSGVSNFVLDSSRGTRSILLRTTRNIGLTDGLPRTPSVQIAARSQGGPPRFHPWEESGTIPFPSPISKNTRSNQRRRCSAKSGYCLSISEKDCSWREWIGCSYSGIKTTSLRRISLISSANSSKVEAFVKLSTVFGLQP